MIGKFFRPFSSDWKTFSGANVLVSGLSPGFANGMRLEGGLPEWKWKRRKSRAGTRRAGQMGAEVSGCTVLDKKLHGVKLRQARFISSQGIEQVEIADAVAVLQERDQYKQYLFFWRAVPGLLPFFLPLPSNVCTNNLPDKTMRFRPMPVNHSTKRICQNFSVFCRHTIHESHDFFRHMHPAFFNLKICSSDKLLKIMIPRCVGTPTFLRNFLQEILNALSLVLMQPKMGLSTSKRSCKTEIIIFSHFSWERREKSRQSSLLQFSFDCQCFCDMENPDDSHLVSCENVFGAIRLINLTKPPACSDTLSDFVQICLPSCIKTFRIESVNIDDNKSIMS